MTRALSSLTVLAFAAIAAAQSPLTTFFTANGGGQPGGAMYFDLTVTHAPGIQITRIDVNATGTGGINGWLDVYTILGGRSGNHGNQAAWTGPNVLGSALATQPIDTPTLCTLNSPIYLPPGVHGVALVASGFGHAYTNGNATNTNHATAEVALAAGESSNLAFSATFFTPRVANCSIHYVAGAPGSVYASKTSYGTGCGSPTPLQLDADVRPLINTTIQMITSNITPTAPFGGLAFGLHQLMPPVSLTNLGMTGCTRYADHLFVVLFFPNGSPTTAVPFGVPNLVNLNLEVQSFSYDPGAILTPLGAVSSNAVQLSTGDW